MASSSLSPAATNNDNDTPSSTLHIHTGPLGSICLALNGDYTSFNTSTNTVVISVESRTASSDSVSDENPFAADWEAQPRDEQQQQEEERDEDDRLLRAIYHLEAFLDMHYRRLEPHAVLRDVLLATVDRLIREMMGEGRFWLEERARWIRRS